MSFFGCPRHWFYLGQNLLVHQSLTSKNQVDRPEGLIEETLSEAGSWQRDFDWQNTKNKHELAMLISLLLNIFRDQFMTCLFSLGVFSFERFSSPIRNQSLSCLGGLGQFHFVLCALVLSTTGGYRDFLLQAESCWPGLTCHGARLIWLTDLTRGQRPC